MLRQHRSPFLLCEGKEGTPHPTPHQPIQLICKRLSYKCEGVRVLPKNLESMGGCLSDVKDPNDDKLNYLLNKYKFFFLLYPYPHCLRLKP